MLRQFLFLGAYVSILTVGIMNSLVAQQPGQSEIRPTAGVADSDANPGYVSIKAYLNVDKLPAGEACKLAVLVNVREGWHVNANPARPDNFVPTALTIKSKSGIELKTVKYPKGEDFAMAGFAEPLSVYEGQVKLLGLLEIPAGAAGMTDELEIVLRYQACNDQSCLPPKTVSVKGKLPIAGFGDPVQNINERLFEDENKPKTP